MGSASFTDLGTGAFVVMSGLTIVDSRVICRPVRGVSIRGLSSSDDASGLLPESEKTLFDILNW